MQIYHLVPLLILILLLFLVAGSFDRLPRRTFDFLDRPLPVGCLPEGLRQYEELAEVEASKGVLAVHVIP